MSPLAMLYLVVLMLATVAASVCGTCLIRSIEGDSKGEACGWAVYFVVTSLLAAYCFFELVEGRVA
ncbi:MAG: hypothetical protein JOZ19_00785 [Rubrobacter sp.]|nr:hypothetical protein [Rubrobacter sp.]